MAGEDTKLSLEDRKRVADWLKERDAPRPCSVCGQNKWTVAGHLVSPTVFHAGSFNLGGSAYPQAMLICSNCAHTVFMNAVLIGLVPSEADDKKAKAEAKAATEGGQDAKPS